MSEHLGHCNKYADFENCECVEGQLSEARAEIESKNTNWLAIKGRVTDLESENARLREALEDIGDGPADVSVQVCLTPYEKYLINKARETLGQEPLDSEALSKPKKEGSARIIDRGRGEPLKMDDKPEKEV